MTSVAAIQFFNALNPGQGNGLGTGLMAGLTGAGTGQGLGMMFQSMMAQSGAVPAGLNTSLVQQSLTQSAQPVAPTHSGAQTPMNSLLAGLPGATLQQTVQALGLVTGPLRENIQAITDQLAVQSPALGQKMQTILDETATAENPDEALMAAIQELANSPEMVQMREDNGIIDHLMAVLDGSAGLFNNIANMNLEEFKAFKESAFSDIAGFITQPKQVLGPDGRVREFLTGPSFLNPEHGTQASVLLDEYRLSVPLDLTTESGVNDWMAALVASPISQMQQTQMNAGLHAQTLGTEEAVIATGREIFGMNARTGQTGIGVNAQTKGTMVSTGTTSGAPNGAPQTSSFNPLATSLFGDAEMGQGFDEQSWFKTDLSPYKAARQAMAMLTDRTLAGQAHNASNNVATAMGRLAATTPAPGESDMTIHLDPPELGRVEVKMRIGADKSVKAHMVVEKPETLALLQRDTNQLNRALTNLGLDTGDGAELTFDLGQGHEFADSHQGKGQQFAFMSEAGETFDDSMTLVETTMDLVTDPTTGLRHLSLLI